MDACQEEQQQQQKAHNGLKKIICTQKMALILTKKSSQKEISATRIASNESRPRRAASTELINVHPTITSTQKLSVTTSLTVYVRLSACLVFQTNVPQHVDPTTAPAATEKPRALPPPPPASPATRISALSPRSKPFARPPPPPASPANFMSPRISPASPPAASASPPPPSMPKSMSVNKKSRNFTRIIWRATNVERSIAMVEGIFRLRNIVVK
mmetsp:Transcript_40583/g.67900  ORF Transcript_40583/g.67900 Transcript_40583/m.67900 type:complete len:214 (-) Transcript_40583:3975-4616(-)